MEGFLQYIFSEVKSNRLSKKAATSLIRQFQTKPVSTEAGFVHPLLHRNTSDLTEQRFSSTFTGQEVFFRNDRSVGKQSFLGLAHLEMARAALEKASGADRGAFVPVRLQNVRWAQPVVTSEKPIQIHIGLYPDKSGEIAFEIYSETNKSGCEGLVYSQGHAILLPDDFEVPHVDILSLIDTCEKITSISEHGNDTISAVGDTSAFVFQNGEEIYIGEGQILVSLAITNLEWRESFVLQPDVMDEILTRSLGYLMGTQETTRLLPMSLEEIEIYQRCSSKIWALIRYRDPRAGSNTFEEIDMDIYGEHGSLCARMKGLTMSVRKTDLKQSLPNSSTFLLQPHWVEQEYVQQNTIPDYTDHLVILCEPNGVSLKKLEQQLNGVRFLTLESMENRIEERFQRYTVQLFEEIQRIIQEKPKGKVLIQIIIGMTEEQQTCSGLMGLLKTAQLENPKLLVQLIEMDDQDQLVSRIVENVRCVSNQHIRYQDGKRFISEWKESVISHELADIPWKNGGNYLITGGAGGLGFIFAEEIVRQVKNATIILTGRSTLGKQAESKINKLQEYGSRIEYRQIDITQETAVISLIQSIQNELGGLQGIIHGAGVIRDSFIFKKTQEELIEVLAPKVTGLVNLDQASRNVNLDFFAIFSSLAGVFGNPGQSDYAAANAFMDRYAIYRNRLTTRKERKGKTISINWPLWKAGGMQVDEENEKVLFDKMGMTAMPSQMGVQAFYHALASGLSNIMVFHGHYPNVQQFLACAPPEGQEPFITEMAVEVESQLLLEKTLHQLKVLFGDITKLDVDKIEADELLEIYGIDSIMITELNQRLASIFGDLSKTLFYEYQTLRALSAYLVSDFPKACLNWVGIAKKPQPKPKMDVEPNNLESDIPLLSSWRAGKKTTRGYRDIDESREPIAIIGISGRYPQARNLDEYWSQLVAGKDCVTEIPKDRWPLEGFYHPNPQDAVAQGKSYSKWGGFLEECTSFDPLFFNISPFEANSMDPQERLFVESCWEVLEDAGYTRERLSSRFNSRVGVFAGITKTGFNLYGPDLRKQGERITPFTSFSSVANRVSYLFNLRGPSMPIDTMCSSSLTAIHEACEHIYRGECEMALAGGVNLYLHPSNYVELCSHRMLSTDGKCKSFGKGGNGFVPGEGVGVILLKRLSQAIEDRDHIYATIKSTSINHGGKTNGYTVPNPTAQGELIRAALDKVGINARTISYIEAHGTGTELGDPIEMTGLTQAFQKDTQDKGFCAIGSVKSNIGHLEAAAGIAGVTKIVLQMKHQKLVPSLYAKELNPNIRFEQSPFVVQQELTEWKRPTVIMNGEVKEYPRVAGISSFGAGGANAHILIEEYMEDNQELTSLEITQQNPAIFVLSAKNEERLFEQAKKLLHAIQKQSFSNENLADMAYTLQVGREAMEERLALIVSSLDELEQKLQQFLYGKQGIADLYRGQVKPNKETFGIFAADEELQEGINQWIHRRKYSKLLHFWVKGLTFDWNKLYGDSKPRCISMPTYSFARETYWLPKGKSSIYAEQPMTNSRGIGSRADYLEIIDASSENVEPSHAENIMLTPVWDEALAHSSPIFLSPTDRIAMIGGNQESREHVQKQYPNAHVLEISPEAKAEDIAKKIGEIGTIDHLIWIAPLSPIEDSKDEMLLEEQNQGVFQVFRIIKALLQVGYGTREIGLFFITIQTQIIHRQETINPTHASLHGLIGSMSKEYPKWKVRLVDVEADKAWPIRDIFALPYDLQGNALVHRDHKWYRQSLIPIQLPFAPEQTRYRKGGVYVVIGGAGGIGEVWSEYMIRKYQAQVVWIGRRERNEGIMQKVNRLALLGPAPIYITADATDQQAMRRAYVEIKKRFPQIHGVIHSAIVLMDQSLANMEEDRFRAGLSAKLDVSVRLAQIFHNEALDFVLFFSGMMSFAKNPGQSNYASGCTFKDAFAMRLSREWSCAVKVMNWGYWGSVGIVASQAYQDRMAREGIGSIEPEDAMEALEALLAGPMDQIALIKMTKPLGKEDSRQEWVEIYPDSSASAIEDVKNRIQLPEIPITTYRLSSSFTRENVSKLSDRTIDFLLQEVSELLQVTVGDIDAGAELQEYGFDPIKLVELINKLNQQFNLDLTSAELTECVTVHQMAQYIVDREGNLFEMNEEEGTST
ncbi:SDR family NAD(P)-dependent oxidoreductase [Brevibacillus laterosporus]|uniref:SDR family NAD(P)-dependent oxidoreductase n=1 Tax=Brevibacillus laterosporus TaxID=1465 RepID=UPI0015E1CF88|nr:SDR family NAD(P)-dependent oxidoreductase [Brevibacillus laterosporus]MED1663358.1 SDR family NAD(P)-dependent oxidoreductase [Brevibacillus laterosporus]MED1668628.1 SDR family NAD(P)-dependent oxidoreductase [Brevibacillus laterosporus]MED1717417.1 SDR family NAD(P)-dependent oxidoreductase [Brevibacillus laterosporus]